MYMKIWKNSFIMLYRFISVYIIKEDKSIVHKWFEPESSNLHFQAGPNLAVNYHVAEKNDWY